VDFGLHLTLTSERVYYRWGPVAPRDRVASLIDENGYFWHDWTASTRIEPKDAEVELRAQIERAYAMGIRPTHLDSHQYPLVCQWKRIIRALLRVAHEKELPFLWRVIGLRSIPTWNQLESRRYGDRSHSDDYSDVRPEKWGDFYRTGDQESAAGNDGVL